VNSRNIGTVHEQAGEPRRVLATPSHLEAFIDELRWERRVPRRGVRVGTARPAVCPRPRVNERPQTADTGRTAFDGAVAVSEGPLAPASVTTVKVARMSGRTQRPV